MREEGGKERRRKGGSREGEKGSRPVFNGIDMAAEQGSRVLSYTPRQKSCLPTRLHSGVHLRRTQAQHTGQTTITLLLVHTTQLSASESHHNSTGFPPIIQFSFPRD